MKICPVGAELLNADRRMDGRTDRHKAANCRFSQFWEMRLKRKIIMRWLC